MRYKSYALLKLNEKSFSQTDEKHNTQRWMIGLMDSVWEIFVFVETSCGKNDSGEFVNRQEKVKRKAQKTTQNAI